MISKIRNSNLIATLRIYIPHFWVNTFYHWPTALLAAIYYGFPARELTVIGVTGSDGKTTTTTGIYHILKTAGKKVSMISTVQAVIGNENIDTGFHVTSPDPWLLQKLIRQIVNQGYEYLVLESTSHGLAQHRLLGVNFAIGVITNVSHEHLDYHGTYENYLLAKAKLFNQVKVAILNGDDRSYELLLNYIKQHNTNAEIISYHINTSDPGAGAGLKPAPEISAPSTNLTATNLKTTAQGTNFTVNWQGHAGVASDAAGAGLPALSEVEGKSAPKHFTISLPLPSQYNVSNALAMIGAALSLGVNHPTISQALKTFPSIPGRMEVISWKGKKIVIDFAHTPNALEQVLKTLRTSLELPLTPSLAKRGKLIAVFGAAGLRDANKRPLMGQAAAKYADVIILTAEDPRTEDVNEIIDQIAKGCIKEGTKEISLPTTSYQLPATSYPVFLRLPDRQQAINLAIKLSQPGDTVGIFGKGHEQSMCFGTTEYPWSDREAVERAISLKKLRPFFLLS